VDVAGHAAEGVLTNRTFIVRVPEAEDGSQEPPPMPWVDVSMPLRVGMPAFPNDPKFASEAVRSVARGDPYTVSRLVLASHAGTHVDPPRHFFPDGADVTQLDLEVLNGPCWVATVDDTRALIEAPDVEGVPAGTQRLLFRTRNSPRWARGAAFFEDFVGLGPTAAEALLARGVRLVGLDALSIESDRTDTYPVHRRLLGEGVVVLEGLVLDGIASGAYDLACLPLPLVGGDGAPARVALRARD
jgi:arylformamidase